MQACCLQLCGWRSHRHCSPMQQCCKSHQALAYMLPATLTEQGHCSNPLLEPVAAQSMPAQLGSACTSSLAASWSQALAAARPARAKPCLATLQHMMAAGDHVPCCPQRFSTALATATINCTCMAACVRMLQCLADHHVHNRAFLALAFMLLYGLDCMYRLCRNCCKQCFCVLAGSV